MVFFSVKIRIRRRSRNACHSCRASGKVKRARHFNGGLKGLPEFVASPPRRDNSSIVPNPWTEAHDYSHYSATRQWPNVDSKNPNRFKFQIKARAQS